MYNILEKLIEIFGKLFNLLQSENKRFIFSTFFVFHFEISGNEVNEKHL